MVNIEFEVKEILRSGAKKENKISSICNITSFKKEDIIKAINIGGSNKCKTVSEIINEIYRNIVKFTEIKNESK